MEKLQLAKPVRRFFHSFWLRALPGNCPLFDARKTLSLICVAFPVRLSRVINGDLNVSEQTTKKAGRHPKSNFQPNLAARTGWPRVIPGYWVRDPQGCPGHLRRAFLCHAHPGVSTRLQRPGLFRDAVAGRANYERRMTRRSYYNGLRRWGDRSIRVMNDTIIDSLGQAEAALRTDRPSPGRQRLLLPRCGQPRRRLPGRALLALQAAGSCPRHWSPEYDCRHPSLPALSMHFTIGDVLYPRAGCGKRLHRGQWLRLYAGPAAPKPDAVFVASDTMALAAIQVIEEHGLCIPDDIAVAGCDDIPQANRITPALTTVRQPITHIDAVGRQTLIDMIETGSTLPRQIVFPAELVIRDSCGANNILKKDLNLS